MRRFIHLVSVELAAIVFCGFGSTSFNALGANAPAGQASDPVVDQAKQLVHDAMHAEADGDAILRAADLKQALALAPDLQEAHWQFGEVRRGDRWLATTDAEHEAATSDKIGEYRKRRDQSGDTSVEQLKLSRWCDRNGLADEAKAHAMIALRSQPDSPEAMRMAGFVKFQGELVSKADLENVKANNRQAITDARQWNQRLLKMQLRYEHEPASRDDVLNEVRGITDIKAIPAIEAVFGNCDPTLAESAIECLAKLQDLRATQALAEFAVLSDSVEVRYAAARALKPRSVYSYVPALLGGLQSEITGGFVSLGLDGYMGLNQLVFFQERADEFVLAVNNEHLIPVGNRGEFIRNVAPVIGSASRENAGFKKALDDVNAKNAEQNRRITTVLAMVTDQQLGPEPKPWWDWWYAQNDYYQSSEKPIRSETYDYTRAVHSECFPKGTPVWTRTGASPIERVRTGDIVLSMNVETGELMYKPVVGIALRPEGPTIQTHVGGTVIKSTRGHPFWVDGIGWQMAKELKTGERLHTINGAVAIEEVTDGDPADCFNLVVADFNTYFVGDAKLLVHDNTLRGPTAAIVPGLAP